MTRRLSGLALAALVAACVPRAEPPPPPQPTPSPAPAPAPAPPPPTPAPVTGDWRDLPYSPGTWSYRRDSRGSTAQFGQAGRDPEFTVRCDIGAGRIYLARHGMAASGTSMTIRTTSTTRAIAMRPNGEQPAYMVAALTPRDSILDAMGFSRGRFVVAMAPLGQLVLPSWAEVLRVTEDCRG